MTEVTWHLKKGDKLVIETFWLRQKETIAGGQIVSELISPPADWKGAEEQESILTQWYPPQAWPLERPVRDVARWVVPTGVNLDALHIALIYRLPTGERLPVTLKHEGWHLDDSGRMLMVPLSTPTGRHPIQANSAIHTIVLLTFITPSVIFVVGRFGGQFGIERVKAPERDFPLFECDAVFLSALCPKSRKWANHDAAQSAKPNTPSNSFTLPGLQTVAQVSPPGKICFVAGILSNTRE